MSPADSVFVVGRHDDPDTYARAASALAAAGTIPINPLFVLASNGYSKEYVQRECLVILIRQATGVALLEGWAEDPWSRLEHAVAVGLGLVVADLDAWTGAEPARAPVPRDDPSDDALAAMVTVISVAPADIEFDGTHRPVDRGGDEYWCTCGKHYEAKEYRDGHIFASNEA